MNNRFFPFTAGMLILILASFPLAASGPGVDYLEGELEYLQGRDTWIEAGIGDTLPEGSTVRLSDRGYAELSVGPKTVTLTSDGVYELSELFSGNPEKENFREVIGSKFAALLGRGRVSDTSTVAAVRQSEYEDLDTISWEDETTDYLSEGMLYFEEGDYESALVQFDEGTLWESGEIQRECIFRKGLSQQALAKHREARETLTGLRPETTDSYFAEYTVVVAALYLESREYREADRVIAAYLDAEPEGEAAQAAWLLSAYSFLDQGKDADANRAARNAVNLGPDTEIGRAAAQLIG